MSDKKTFQRDIRNLQSEVKKLTKFLIDHFDPNKVYEDKLMAECSARCERLKLLESRTINLTDDELSKLTDKELNLTWYRFSYILAVSPDYIESQYFQFIKK